MDNMATNVYTKSNDDRVRLDKALGFFEKSYDNTHRSTRTRSQRTFVAVGTPFRVRKLIAQQRYYSKTKNLIWHLIIILFLQFLR